MLKVCALQSGSSGNCTLVEGGGTRVVVDSGLSARKLIDRLAAVGVDPGSIDALLITHEHWDHVGGAGQIHRKLKIPIFISELTYAVSEKHIRKTHALEFFKNDSEFQIGDLRVTAVPTSHDVVDGTSFCFEHAGARFGLFTDTGVPTPAIERALGTLDAALFETNYDPDMLHNGPYPAHLKKRISGDYGHLSNDQAADCLYHHAGARLQKLFLAHLSKENNHPMLAYKAVSRKLRDKSDFARLDYIMTYRDRATALHEIRS